jgi:hypothetical protein
MGSICMASFSAARQITGSLPEFVIHDIAPKGAQPAEAQAFSSRAMSYNKYTKCLETLLMMPPLAMTAEQAGAVVTYRARRWLPSVVGLMDFTDPEAASVGNWKITAEAGNATISVTSTMHVRYSDTKLQRAAMTKVAAIFALRSAVQKAESFDIPWGSLPQFLPSVDWARLQAKSAGEGLTELLPKRTPAPLIPSCFSLKPDASYSATLLPDNTYQPQIKASSAQAPSSSSSQSSSASSATESAESLEDLTDTDMLQANELFWAAPKHRTAVMHIFRSFEASRLECLCGFRLKPETPHGQGLRSAPQVGMAWHAACLLRLPDALRDELRGSK